MNQKYILVTGGAGYIGSHTCIALHEAGYVPVILDNFSNSNISVIQRMEEIMKVQPHFIEGDIRNGSLLTKIFQNYSCSAVIHFAGLKAVGESVIHPLKYYTDNVAGTLQLMMVMENMNVKTLVFSSSAAVYGNASAVPIPENTTRLATSPYGRSKLMVEDILEDLHHSSPSWKIARLRYFNPVGAHPSGLIGEAPKGEPSNLMPYIEQVASGLRKKLSIFGDDYPTRDGTAVRDYIHVMDLAEGHVAALKHGEHSAEMLTVNLGTGEGTSVLELVQSFEAATGKKIPYKVVPRRAGDIAQCWADTNYATNVLKWKATRSISDMCRDSWRWQQSYATEHYKENL